MLRDTKGVSKKLPKLVRIINKQSNSFNDQIKPGGNLRLMRQKVTVTQNVSNFIILKSDLTHIKLLNDYSSDMVQNDMTSVIKFGVQKK
jgi:hypothetical protein